MHQQKDIGGEQNVGNHLLGDWVCLEASKVCEGKESYGEKVEKGEEEGGKMDLGQFQPLQLDERFKERMLQQLLSVVVNNLE